VLEDKLLQVAVTQILLAIYEVDFLPCSYGYRQGLSAHDAIKALTDELQFGGHHFLVEVDIKGFLDPYSYYTLAVEGGSKSWG
jgi:retron-type reverse transcriptase